MILYLSYSDICKTNTKYLVSSIQLGENNTYYSEIYNENNMYIYQTVCEGSAK